MCVNILRNVTVQLRCRHECLQFSTNFIFLTHPPFAIVPFYSVFFLWFSVSFIDGLKTSYPKYLARHLINVARIHPCIVLIMRATHENKMKCTEIANKKNPSLKWTKMSEREIEEMQNETDKRTATEAAATNGTGQSRENINKENTCIYVWNGIEIFRRSEREWRVNGEKRHTHTHYDWAIHSKYASISLFVCLEICYSHFHWTVQMVYKSMRWEFEHLYCRSEMRTRHTAAPAAGNQTPNQTKCFLYRWLRERACAFKCVSMWVCVGYAFCINIQLGSLNFHFIPFYFISFRLFSLLVRISSTPSSQVAELYTSLLSVTHLFFTLSIHFIVATRVIPFVFIFALSHSLFLSHFFLSSTDSNRTCFISMFANVCSPIFGVNHFGCINSLFQNGRSESSTSILIRYDFGKGKHLLLLRKQCAILYGFLLCFDGAEQRKHLFRDVCGTTKSLKTICYYPLTF